MYYRRTPWIRSCDVFLGLPVQWVALGTVVKIRMKIGISVASLCRPLTQGITSPVGQSQWAFPSKHRNRLQHSCLE